MKVSIYSYDNNLLRPTKHLECIYEHEGSLDKVKIITHALEWVRAHRSNMQHPFVSIVLRYDGFEVTYNF